jgi:hypothetical protein
MSEPKPKFTFNEMVSTKISGVVGSFKIEQHIDLYVKNIEIVSTSGPNSYIYGLSKCKTKEYANSVSDIYVDECNVMKKEKTA